MVSKIFSVHSGRIEFILNNKNDYTPFKKILEFHEQTFGKSDDEKQIIAQNLAIDFGEYQRRIRGKEKEIEFLIIMRSLPSFKEIKVIDEELSQISGEKTPDYEVEFTDGYKMMLEVKHTDKDEYKISGGNLQKRINYAKEHGLALRFAISIKEFWGLFTSDFILSKNGKIVVSDFIGNDRNSWLDRELETCSYMFMKPLKIVSVYSNKTTRGLGVFFDPYGELVSYELYYSEHLIFKVDHEDRSKRLHMFILETIQDRLSKISQDIIINENSTTIIEHNNNSPHQCFAEYLFILAVIRHMRYNGKNSRDNIFLTANEGNNLLSVEYIRLVMSDLSNLGVEIFCLKDGLGYLFEDYRNNFWNKKRDDAGK